MTNATTPLPRLSRCDFQATDLGWKCAQCGRSSKSPKKPVAVCRIAADLLKERYGEHAKSLAAAMPEVSVVRTPAGPNHGPGTELKKLLKKVGITAAPGCKCNARAREMDARGCEWCEAHIDEIVGWLREEATKRKLPFLDAAGRVLVRRAIKNARRAAS